MTSMKHLFRNDTLKQFNFGALTGSPTSCKGNSNMQLKFKADKNLQDGARAHHVSSTRVSPVAKGTGLSKSPSGRRLQAYAQMTFTSISPKSPPIKKLSAFSDWRQEPGLDRDPGEMKLYNKRTNIFKDEEVSLLEGKLRQVECTNSINDQTTEGQTVIDWKPTAELTDATSRPTSTFESEQTISDKTLAEDEVKKVKEARSSSNMSGSKVAVSKRNTARESNKQCLFIEQNGHQSQLVVDEESSSDEASIVQEQKPRILTLKKKSDRKEHFLQKLEKQSSVQVLDQVDQLQQEQNVLSERKMHVPKSRNIQALTKNFSDANILGWPSEAILDKFVKPVWSPTPQKLNQVFNFSQTLNKMSPDKPTQKMNLHIAQLKKKTNQKFSQLMKKTDMPELKGFEESKVMLKLNASKLDIETDEESPKKRLQISIPDDNTSEDEPTQVKQAEHQESPNSKRPLRRLKFKSEEIIMADATLRANKVIEKKKIRFLNRNGQQESTSKRTVSAFQAIPEGSTAAENQQQSPKTMTRRHSERNSHAPVFNFTESVNVASSRNTPSKPQLMRSSTATRAKKRISSGHREAVHRNLFSDNNLNQDPIQITETLYKTVLQNGLAKAMEYTEKNEYGMSIDLLSDLLPLCEHAIDLSDCMQLHALIAWQEFTRKNYKKAVDHSDLVVALCGSNEAMCDAKGESLKLKALCKLHMKEYQEAIRAFKLCFEHSLVTNNQQFETEIFEKLSICNFYLGDLEKSKYYKQRHLLGITEPPGSQIRGIYQALRKKFQNRTKETQLKYWSTRCLTVSDFSWQGENIFELYYQKFVQGQRQKDAAILLLMRGQFPPERIATISGFRKSSLLFRIAEALLIKVSREFQRAIREQTDSNNPAVDKLELSKNWKKAYHLKKLKQEYENLAGVRTEIFLFVQKHKICHFMPQEMQNEIKTISKTLQNERQAEFDECTQEYKLTRPLKFVPKVKLMIPMLGSIFENQIDELPSPDMVPIEDESEPARKYKKAPQKKEYSTNQLRDICPSLYQNGRKAMLIKNALEEIDIISKLKDHQNPDDKHNQRLKLKLRQVRMREKAQVTHLAPSRESVKLRFKSERDKKEYQSRHFKMFDMKLKGQLEKLLAERLPYNSIGQGQSKAQDLDGGETRKDHSRHLIDTRILLANDMVIKAFFYGEDIVRDLVADYNNFMRNGRRRTFGQISGFETEKSRYPSMRQIPQSCKNGQSHLMKITPVSVVSPSVKAQRRGLLRQLNLEYEESANSAFKTNVDQNENDKFSKLDLASTVDKKFAFKNFQSTAEQQLTLQNTTGENFFSENDHTTKSTRDAQRHWSDQIARYQGTDPVQRIVCSNIETHNKVHKTRIFNPFTFITLSQQ